MKTSETLLELKDVFKRYEDSGGNDTPYVLNGVSLKVSAGERIAVVGPSGSGKSTLLNIMGTLDNPSKGQVLFEGQDCSCLSEKELALHRNKAIGFVFQSHHLLPHCSVLENALVPTLAFPSTSNPKESEDRARYLLTKVGLEHRISYRPGNLSGGERQRVAVVRALINRPRLLLADEPTGSLDRESGRSLMDLLDSLNHEEGVTVVLVSHALELISGMDRVLEIRDGKLVSRGAST